MNRYLNPIGLVLENFYAVADWSQEVAAYVNLHELDLEAVNAYAGILAIVGCKFLGNGAFKFDAGGEPGVVIEVLADDAETTIDLVAWPVDASEAFATAVGDGYALGIGNVTNAASWALGNVLRIHRTPLAWLQAGCSGVCALDHRFMTHWLRAALGPIAVEDAEHGRQVLAMLNPRPFPKNRIIVPRKRAA